MAVNTFRNKTRSTPMARYIHSTIQCQVALDRLDQAAIDQIIEASTTDTRTQTIAIVSIPIYLCLVFKISFRLFLASTSIIINVINSNEHNDNNCQT